MTLKYQDREHKINVVASHTYGIFENEMQVGKFCLLFTNKVVSLWGLEIFSDYQRKGYAKKLLQGVIKALREQGRHVLALYVKKDNHAAIRLYEDLGFVYINQEDSLSYYYELDLTNISIGTLPHFKDCKEIDI